MEILTFIVWMYGLSFSLGLASFVLHKLFQRESYEQDIAKLTAELAQRTRIEEQFLDLKKEVESYQSKLNAISFKFNLK